MREKAFFWINVCVVTVFVTAVAVLFITGERKRHYELQRLQIKKNFDRIAVGMSQEEVESILGPGTIPSDPNFRLWTQWGTIGGVPVEWHDERGSIAVAFRNGKLVIKKYYPNSLGPSRNPRLPH